ncbi:MAG: hypothetical protein ACKV0T_02510 [Planctomycetales bacterium]
MSADTWGAGVFNVAAAHLEVNWVVESSLATSCYVFLSVFAGALCGMFVRPVLPDHHLNAESRDTMKLGLGLIGTMSALILGLLVSSAKSSYDAQKTEIMQLSAKVILLDRIIAHYGPEAAPIRAQLRTLTQHTLYQLWPEHKSRPASLKPETNSSEALFDKIHELAPGSEMQTVLKSRAQNLTIEISETRWLLFEQSSSAISAPFLIVLGVWLTIIFSGFGLMAPRNLTVTVTLLLCALSVACAVFLILELDRPFDGMIQISSEPFQKALATLGE